MVYGVADLCAETWLTRAARLTPLVDAGAACVTIVHDIAPIAFDTSAAVPITYPLSGAVVIGVAAVCAPTVPTETLA